MSTQLTEEPLIMPPKTVRGTRATRSSNTSSKSTKKISTRTGSVTVHGGGVVCGVAEPSGGSALSSSSAAPPACSGQSPASSSASSASVLGVAAKTTSNAELCAVCCQKIVDGKEDALFCEGSYKQWCHRYSIGVPLRHLVSLATSSSPFICPTCSQSVYEQEISLLKASVALLQEENRTLKAEVLSLKERNQSLQEDLPSVSRDLISCENAGSGRGGVCGRVRGRGRRGAGRGGGGGGGRGGGGRSREDFGGQGGSERLGVTDHGHINSSSGVGDGCGSGDG